MLQATNLTIGHKKSTPLISGINFACNKGELIILLGVNGIGKSTMLKTLCGLIEPISGNISIGNTNNIFALPPNERAKLISAVFTGRDIDNFINVRELIMLGRYPYTNWLGAATTNDIAALDNAINTLGLQKLANKKVLQISDGEKQKAFIARALAQDTPVIIMDEPTAFLDYKNKAELLSTIKNLCTTQNKTIILSTHDITASLPYSDRAFLVSEKGKFIDVENTGYNESYLRALMEESTIQI